MLNIITNGYFLRCISKPNLVRAHLIHSGYKAPQKELALTSYIQSLPSKKTIEKVKKISWVLQLLVSSTQASPNMEASYRHKKAKHPPAREKVQNGNTRIYQVFSHSSEVGVIDRPSRRLPSHPHPPKLKEVPKILPQVTGISIHFPSLRTSHGPSGLYNDCKRGKANGPVKGKQTSPIPSRLAVQGPVSGRLTLVDLT